ncbi:MAG: DUF3703 domain-containing protein [Chitinophagaceae bacterium]|nr:MAG: DUF3703 domain-containing protein [Chitinophagaceae bacterium]
MKLYTTMPAALKPYYQQELLQAANTFKEQQYQLSWQHLERAHILGQRYPIEHTAVHWKMLRFGFKIKNRKEIVGQLPRLLLGGIMSFVGKVPVGNPGGANVPPMKPMEIPADLASIINNTTAG